MLTTIGIFTLLLICARVPYADGLEFQTCELYSSEEIIYEDVVVGLCVKKSRCQEKETSVGKKHAVDPATSFVPRSWDEEIYIDPDNPHCTKHSEVCCELANVLPDVVPPVEPTGCGLSKPVTPLKTTPGLADYSRFAEFPWMVALMLNNKGATASESYIGGGTLIHPSVVMTVAHKVEDISDTKQIRCRAGEFDLTADNETYIHQERDVGNIIIHPSFNKSLNYYDVALLILSSPFDVSLHPHVGVACLEPHMPPPGTTCYSMGWGRDYDGSPHAAFLKKLTLPLVEDARCEEQFRKTKFGNSFRLHPTLTCAGGEAKVDTCIGDGGAPLVCPVESGINIRYSVVGMVSYGLGCGKKNYPGVYVNVPAVYDWVVNQMRSKTLDFNTFVY